MTCSIFNSPPSLNVLLMQAVPQNPDPASEIHYWHRRLFSSLTRSAIKPFKSMGLLDQLWDDTVAGPRPDNGLGKLRKHKTFSARAGTGKESCEGNVRLYDEGSVEEALRVTRHIMIVKPPGYQSASPPVSPAGSTPPVSPFSGAKESFRFRRRSTSDACEKPSQNRSSSGSSSPFDV